MRWALVALTLLVACHCGGVKPYEPDAVTRSCIVSASALCQRAEECSPAFVLSQFGSRSRCEEVTRFRCARQYAVRETDEQPPTCEAAARAASCAELTDGRIFYHGGLIAVCPRPRGRLPLGARCAMDSNCESGACSIDLMCGGGCTRRCGQCILAAREGELCDRHVCEEGLTCHNDPIDPDRPPSLTCRRWSQPGEACNDTDRRCAGSGFSMACDDGRCVSLALEGEGCSDKRPCNRTLGLVCSAEHRCARVPVTAPEPTSEDLTDDGMSYDCAL